MKGKLLPQAINSEEIVLGSIMIDKHAYSEVESNFDPNIFYKTTHQEIAKAFIQLKENYDPIDSISVAEQLHKNGKLNDVGGVFTLTQLTDRVSSSANMSYHLKIVREKAFRREIIDKSQKLIKNAYDESMDIFDLLENAEKEIAQINSVKSEAVIKTLEEVNNTVISDIERAKENPNEIIGIPYGYTSLDKRFGGKKEGNLIILAARPAMGKSGLMNNAAKNAAELGKNIAIFSLEMPSKELATRLISTELEINSRRIQEAKLNEYEFMNLQQKIEYLNKLGIFIVDKPAISISQLKAIARQIKTKHGLDEIWIDYLQLMKGSGKRGNREQEISEISRGLKELAKELELPIIALSQLSRAVETRGGDKRPLLSDLRESGAIEQDADIVMFLYRPEYYGILEDENGDSTIGITEVITAKFRGGSTGTDKLRFIGQFVKFEDLF